jgi:hypothetical protein
MLMWCMIENIEGLAQSRTPPLPKGLPSLRLCDLACSFDSAEVMPLLQYGHTEGGGKSGSHRSCLWSTRLNVEERPRRTRLVIREEPALPHREYQAHLYY